MADTDGMGVLAAQDNYDPGTGMAYPTAERRADMPSINWGHGFDNLAHMTWNGLTYPDRLMQGEEPSDTESMIPWATGTALSTIGSGAPFALRNAAGAAGGRLLQPTPPSAIRQASSVFDFNKPGDPQMWHRIANRKLDRPLDSIPVELSGEAPTPATVIDPATLEGKFLMPLPGDPTRRGTIINSIDDVPLSKPFQTQGGRSYIDDLQGFANADTAATTASRRVQRLQDMFGTDVVGSYLKMGPQSADFSSHTWSPLARMMPEAPMTRAARSDLNEAIRGEVGKFPGVGSPNLEQHLAASPDQYRKGFINAVEKQRGKIEGVPDVVAVRYAATDPALLNAPTNSSGLSMTTLTGKTSPSTHRDYPVHLEGEGSFGLGQMLPREVMFSDLAQYFNSRHPTAPDRWLRPMQLGPADHPYGQLATPKWVDATSKYQENAAKMGGAAALDKYLLDNFGWK
jgi:hypothetical protein